MKKKPMQEFLSTSIYFLTVLILVFLTVTYVGQRIEVIGLSMYPTLNDGDSLLIDKLSYRISDPKRFDIISFPYRYEANTFYIKRIIGLPGERIYINSEGEIYINGELLKEGYGRETIIDPGRAYEEIQLGDDEYFVMGDNRNNSADSRDPSVGNIKRDELRGRVFMRVFPIRNMCIIKHQ